MDDSTEKERIRKINEDFINLSTLDIKSKLFYPFSDMNVNRFSDSKKKLNSKKFCSLLVQSNKKLFKSDNNNKYAVIKLKNYDSWYKRINDPKLKKVISGIKDRFDEKLSRYGDLIIHGSFSTLDYVKGWSDLDFIVIVKKGCLFEEKKILHIRKEINRIRNDFYLIDPVQHHGFFIIPEEYLDDYYESLFPLETFNNAVGFNNDLLKVRTRMPNNEYVKDVLLSYCFDLKKKPRNIYEWKLHISKALLMPSLFIESKGEYVYKKDSFQRIRKYLTKDELKLLNNIENLRLNWKLPFGIGAVKMLAKISPNPFIPLIPSLIIKPGNINKSAKDIIMFAEVLSKK